MNLRACVRCVLAAAVPGGLAWSVSPLARNRSEPVPVIVSTDCGTEIDDQWAVMYVAISPEIRVQGFLGNHARNGLTGARARDAIRDVMNDPAADRVVFESGVPLAVGGADVCLRDLSLTTETCRDLLSGTGSAGAWLARSFAEFEHRFEQQDRRVWPIWDMIAPAHIVGFTRSVEHHRPGIAADLAFDHSEARGQLTWIEAVDTEELWPDFVDKLHAWEARRQSAPAAAAAARD